MRVGFTGTRNVRDLDRDTILIHLTSLDQATEFTTGSCVGIDAIVGRTLVAIFPAAKHRVIVPADRKQVNYWWHPLEQWEAKGIELEVELMPVGTSYRDRNERIVDHSDMVMAFAEKPEEHGASKRSGTWMTVRIARKRGIPVQEVVFEDLCTSSVMSGNVSRNDGATKGNETP